MIGALEIVISVTSLLLVVLILLHRGKGGGLSDMFGGGFTSSFAGSSVVERNLDRFTLITAFIWFASIVGLLLLFKG
ncbi:MAG TPA: preprotein translocase subunit SecG [Acidothermaceae bacterium]